MRRFSLLLLTFVSLITLSTAVCAQVFYEYPGAPVTKENEPIIGPSIAIGEDLFRINGFARFNVSLPVDFGLEMVFDHSNDIWRVGAGGDVKYAIVPKNTTMPFDLAVNAGFGFESGGDVTTILVPIGGIISRPLELSSGKLIVPYGGVYLLLIHTSFDSDVPGRDTSDTDTDVELRGGVKVEINYQAGVFTALHVGTETMFYMGLSWRL